MPSKDQDFPQAKNTLLELATELQFFQAELDQRYIIIFHLPIKTFCLFVLKGIKIEKN